MGAILAIIGKGKDPQLVKQLSKRMSHRGPNNSGLKVTEKGYILSHEGLFAKDSERGQQPIQGTTSSWMVKDGIIYNYQELKDSILKDCVFRTQTDSEVILHLYEKFGYDFCNNLDGSFAFIVIDGEDFIAARDPLGVKPLYYGLDERGRIYFASEMKAIADQCKTFSTFPPGHYYTPKTGFVKYYLPEYEDFEAADQNLDLQLLREMLIESTRKRLTGDATVGVLLSGGLDSSIISSIASRLMKEEGKKLKSFAIGLDANAPDILAAKQVATFLDTDHHEYYFTVEEGTAVLKELILHLETYDITSIRASVPLYFLSKFIVESDVKVVLSGEGADEIFGGYLYFRNAPSAEDFQKETIERVQKLFTADLLRSDKATMANGVEARVPFLDKGFLDVAMRIKSFEKQPKTYEGKEKYILRKAFDTPDEPYLPQEVLWRQKEQFSDGVGYSWIDELVAYCATQVTDEQLEGAAAEFAYNAPTTKEAYLYRSIFHEFFPQISAAQTVRRWIPKWQESLDPSGRANKAHIKTSLVTKKETTF